ncbi:hypothetical protein ONZ45_g15148 [Pleurotus djamor]|nr:hypothetical protein ONZ45_g15148 [Pleurotus djamor]
MAQLAKSLPSPLAAKLPPELLAEVFTYIAPGFDANPTDVTCWTRWIRTTHVCHYWHEVAEEDSRLWTAILLNHTGICELFRLRSGSLPVSLLCDIDIVGSAWINDLLEAFLSQGDRSKIKSMKLLGLKSDLLQLFDTVGKFSLLNLEIIPNLTTHSNAEAFWLPDLQFGPEFIGGLTTLSTTRCAFLPDSVYAPNLTTLELRSLPLSQTITIIELISVLRRLPKLKHLTVIRSLIPEIDETAAAQQTPVVLPNLRSIHFSERPPVSFFLLALLEAPEFNSLNIGLDPRPLGPSKFDPLTVVFSYACTLLPQRRPYIELRLQIQDRGTGVIRLRTSISTLLTIRVTPPPEHEKTSKPSLVGMALSTRKSLSTKLDIRFLELEDVPHTYKSETAENLLGYEEDWTTLFSGLTSVRVLRLRTYRPPLLIETLFERAMQCIGFGRKPSTQHIDPFGFSRQLLPHLETIEFVDFSFSPSTPVNTHKHVAEFPLQDLLLAYLWAITQHSYSKPPFVTMKNCTGVDRQWVKQLQTHTRVEWDGLNEVENLSESPWLPPDQVFESVAAWCKLFDKQEDA